MKDNILLHIYEKLLSIEADICFIKMRMADEKDCQVHEELKGMSLDDYAMGDGLSRRSPAKEEHDKSKSRCCPDK